MKYKNICGKKNAYILNNDICEKFLTKTSHTDVVC